MIRGENRTGDQPGRKIVHEVAADRDENARAPGGAVRRAGHGLP
jgi:hypothetical protein